MQTLSGCVARQQATMKTLATRHILLQKVLEGKSEKGDRPTLAQLTRVFRLSKLMEVLKDCVAMETKLLSWYAGLNEEVQNDVENSLQTTCYKLDKESKVLLGVWETSSPPKVKEECLLDTAIVNEELEQMEKKLARTHNALDAFLTSLRELAKVIQSSDVMFKVDVQVEHVDLILMRMPDQYILPNEKPQMRQSFKKHPFQMHGQLVV